ncbi:MAG: two-component system chemotaxis response regulator CheB [Candidatus Azotimanducaceae bacterium]|jgi:two-component system chemotaxis response regulator CheB
MYELVVIGVSAGGMQALSTLLPALPDDYKIPVVIVQHIGANNNDYLPSYYSRICQLPVCWASPAMPIAEGHIYFAPPGYHLLVENDRTFSLSVDDSVNHSRPSIDVLFDSAADVFGEKLVGVILTGASSDGSQGLRNIKNHNGLTLVQDPDEAEVETMPRAAIETVGIDKTFSLNKLKLLLMDL